MPILGIESGDKPLSWRLSILQDGQSQQAVHPACYAECWQRPQLWEHRVGGFREEQEEVSQWRPKDEGRRAPAEETGSKRACVTSKEPDVHDGQSLSMRWWVLSSNTGKQSGKTIWDLKCYSVQLRTAAWYREAVNERSMGVQSPLKHGKGF